MEDSPVEHPEPIQVRNSRVALALLFASGLGCLLLTPCAIFIAIVSLLTKTPFERMYGILAGICGAYLLGNIGLFLSRQAPKMMHNHVVFTAGGVRFGIMTGDHETRAYFAWGDIRAVTCSRIAHVCVCTVQGASGRSFHFDSYTFLRPRHIADLITQGVKTNSPEIHS